MKLALLLCANAAITAFAQQNFDFKTLDKLGANAKESTNVTLEGDTLKLATSVLSDDDDDDREMQSLVKNLKGIYVRSFEYEKPGQYDPADLASVRAYVKSLHWTKIVDVKEANATTTEIYLQPLPNNRLAGLAVISAEPQEVTVVFINGDMNMSDIGKLSGNMGIPDMRLDHGGKKSRDSKSDSKPDSKPDSKKD